MNKLRVVLDTNVLLVSISSMSKHHFVFSNLLKAQYEMFITTDILKEYEEIITNKWSISVARNVIRALILLPNVHQVNVYYNWNLIEADESDNKFIDCAFAANAQVLVTNDKHFNVLKNIGFPKILVNNVNEFKIILEKSIKQDEK